MSIKVEENNKKREIRLEDGIIYQETISDEASDSIEFITMVKQSDYSFYYFGMLEDEKADSKTFEIEPDSFVYEALFALLNGSSELTINDDYSERKITFSWGEDASIKMQVHLLPGESDGTIELKNIMFDLRSAADQDGLDIKDKLSHFFELLVQIAEMMEKNNDEVKLVNKMSQE